jgi:hypothetical protein
MKILIACEYSGRVRDAFRDKGHDAWSCDILPTEGREEYNQYHYQQDVFEVINFGWDMMIAFPPCTHLSVMGAVHWKREGRKELQQDACQFFMNLYNASIKHIAIENPVGYMNTAFRKPDQIIQPYQFGFPTKKRTCLWLKSLPKLMPTNVVEPIPSGYYKTGRKAGKPFYWVDGNANPKDRQKIRSMTFEGIALAMADQWSNL